MRKLTFAVSVLSRLASSAKALKKVVKIATKSSWYVAAFLTVGFPLSSAIAGDATVQPDGSAVWQAGIDGVEIEWNPDHSVKRIYSMFEQPVNFPDRSGILTAQTIAEEKAKAAIIRFMSQSSRSTRVVTEVNNDMEKATRIRSDSAAESKAKTDERTMIKNLTEITSSFASGTLQGVIVLERGYDEKEEAAWTKVGISQKTIAAARELQNMTNSPPTPVVPSGQNLGSSGSISHPGNEIKKTNQADW